MRCKDLEQIMLTLLSGKGECKAVINFFRRKNLTEREELLYMPVLHWMFVVKPRIYMDYTESSTEHIEMCEGSPACLRLAQLRTP